MCGLRPTFLTHGDCRKTPAFAEPSMPNQPAAEVKADSARHLNAWGLQKIARVSKTLMCGGLRRK